MLFSSPLIRGRLIKRYKRFLADVELADGQIVTAHCANTGAMTGCAKPGFVAWLSEHSDPKRKLKYSWELAQNTDGEFIGINTHKANKLVAEALDQGIITQLQGYETIKPEVRYGRENSRIDFLLQSPGREDCYVEVKSVTLLEDGQGFFPDTRTARGTKHIRELMEMRQLGHRAVLLFCVQHTGISSVSPAAHLDPEYAESLVQAAEAGVEITAWSCEIDQEKVLINQSLPVKM